MAIDLENLVVQIIRQPVLWKVIPLGLLWTAYRVNRYLNRQALNNGVHQGAQGRAQFYSVSEKRQG
ncbi:hypothetical protein N7466_003706 [Penicillium verhagenii]|uniref:uncharacterized protein n=1 Tax=Penicillium verhagenii TaxID=1562060 RepID=UPI0025458188|nr:uncharacterized protein N7466_003706 [Penicillium verhagenii]KAJ5934159.1 hypothetical protein N7466_003706 [Penicillium verhagenii]